MLNFVFNCLKLHFKIIFFNNSGRFVNLIWIILIISNFIPFASSSQLIIIQNEFCKFNFNTPKFDKNFIIDTLNQLQLNGTTRIISEQLKIDDIELFSKFDGNYALQFLPIFFNCDSNDICKTNFKTIPTDEFSTKAALFTGSKNGFFQGYHKGRYRTFSWLIHPYLEINNGIYYPDNEQTFLNQKLVANSSFQNISGRTEFGIQNEKSYLLFDSHISFANLYKPLNLLDSNKIKHKFDSYNNLLTQIKFSNTFSDFIRFTGRIYLKNFLRDYSTFVDSTIFSFDIYNNEFEVEEFNYGFNTIIDYDSRILNNPVQFNFSYSQDLFLVNSTFLKVRSRIESENLKVGISQKFDYSDNGVVNIAINSYSRALLYSSLGTLPPNLHTLNLELKNYLKIDSTLQLTNSIYRKYYLPLIGNYYSISENYLNNLNLQPELWYYFSNALDINFTKNLNIKSFINLYYGQDIIVLDKINSKYFNNGESKGAEVGIDGEYRYGIINFRINTYYNFQNVSNKEILVSNFLRMPKFTANINLNHLFYDFVELELNFKYLSGINSYNVQTHTIEMVKPNYLLNLLIQKQYDNAFFTLILRNLTNRYHETNIGIPDRGISFLLGTGINF